MNCELNWCSRQEYVMGGSYIDYGYPVDPEGEATVQVHNYPPTQLHSLLKRYSQVEYVGSADIQRMATEATIE